MVTRKEPKRHVVVTMEYDVKVNVASMASHGGRSEMTQADFDKMLRKSLQRDGRPR